jgi:phosphocarrier protein HPr
MPEVDVIIANSLGLHARAAAKVVRSASQFVSAVTITRLDTGETADAKDILDILYLAAGCGTAVRLMAVGEDEDAAMASVLSLIESKFDEK